MELHRAVARLAQALDLGERALRRARMLLVRQRFATHGRNVVFDPRDIFTYETIHIGDDVYIGPGAMFAASETTITIGNKVMFGPKVSLLGGNHNTSVVGAYMYDVKEKRAEDDLPILIEDDVWIGAGAYVLKGVTIGRGAIVGAAALVTKDVPPYSVVAGNPARVVKMRFPPDELERHRAAMESREP